MAWPINAVDNSVFLQMNLTLNEYMLQISTAFMLNGEIPLFWLQSQIAKFVICESYNFGYFVASSQNSKNITNIVNHSCVSQEDFMMCWIPQSMVLP